jgi:hypothetical protein
MLNQYILIFEEFVIQQIHGVWILLSANQYGSNYDFKRLK